MLYKFETDSAYFANVTSKPEVLSFVWDWDENKGKGTLISFEWRHTENPDNFRSLFPADDSNPSTIEGVIVPKPLAEPPFEQLGLNFDLKVGVQNQGINPEIMTGFLRISREDIVLASNFQGGTSDWLVAHGTVTQSEEE